MLVRAKLYADSTLYKKEKAPHFCIDSALRYTAISLALSCVSQRGVGLHAVKYTESFI